MFYIQKKKLVKKAGIVQGASSGDGHSGESELPVLGGGQAEACPSVMDTVPGCPD